MYNTAHLVKFLFNVDRCMNQQAGENQFKEI